MNSTPKDATLRDKLNLETAAIPWSELLRFFANGSVIQIAPDLDLIDVAARMSSDDTESISRWIEDGRIARVTDEQAQTWVERDTEVWTVVVKPWILVQDQSAV